MTEEVCGLNHPDFPDVHCTLRAPHPRSDVHLGVRRFLDADGMHSWEPVEWPNEDYAPPLPRIPPRQKKAYLRELARRVGPELRADEVEVSRSQARLRRATSKLQLLTVEETASLLRFDVQEIRDWIQAGHLPAIQLDDQTRVSVNDLRTFISKRRSDDG